MTLFEELMLVFVFLGFASVCELLKETNSKLGAMGSEISNIEEDILDMKPDLGDYVD